MPDLNVTDAVTFYKILMVRSVERPFYKLEVAGSKLNISSFFFFLFFFKIIVILVYCKVDYKVFIFRNNTLIYLSRMESCLGWWSCYNNSLAQRPISHRIHSFLVNDVSVESTTAVANLIGCVSISCASGHWFSFRAGETYRKSLNLYQMLLAWSSAHMHRYVRRHAHRQARARTSNYHGPQTKLKVDLQW